MKKKGFTLIELIGVITILGVLVLIIYPVIEDVFNDSSSNLSKSQKESLENKQFNTPRYLPKDGRFSLIFQTDSFRFLNNKILLTIPKEFKDKFNINFLEYMRLPCTVARKMDEVADQVIRPIEDEENKIKNQALENQMNNLDK